MSLTRDREPVIVSWLTIYGKIAIRTMRYIIHRADGCLTWVHPADDPDAPMLRLAQPGNWRKVPHEA